MIGEFRSGPAVFVVTGAETLENVIASAATATAGAGGTGPALANGGTVGLADATPVFNSKGTINGVPTTGPAAGAVMTSTLRTRAKTTKHTA